MKKDSKFHTAKKYAEVLYSEASENNSAAKVKADADNMLEIISADKTLVSMLSSPLWSKDSKKEAVKAVSAKMSLSPYMFRCLKLMIDNNRIPELDLMLRQYRHIFYKKQNIKEVEIHSVKELTSDQDKKLKGCLEKMLSSKVVLDYKIHPDIIGGLIVRYDSHMIDDSIKGKLNKIELFMKGEQ